MEGLDPTWKRLKPVLRGLARDRRRPLRAFPDPAVDHDRAPPYDLTLAAWAVEQAANLHTRFGDGVRLTVGFLAYPPPPERPEGSSNTTGPGTEPLLDPNLLTVGPEESLEVRSGHLLRARLLCSNRAGEALALLSTGSVLGRVVDPTNRRIVGGYEGAVTLARVRQPVGPHCTARVSLLAGTASLDGRLGYAVPPGRWALEAILELEGRGRYRTPLLPLTVTG